MREYETRAEKRRRQSKIGFITMGAVVLGTAIIAGIYIWTGERMAMPDAEICPQNFKHHPIPEQRAILIDVSDKTTPLMQRSIRRYITRIHEEAPLHTRISIYTIRHGGLDDTTDAGITPELTICRPDDGEEASGVYENPDLIKKTYKEKFLIPLQGLVEEALSTPQPSKKSPILEKLLHIEAAAFPLKDIGPDKSRKIEKRVYIISDMLQNSKDWSHYKEGTSYRVFRDRGKEHTFIANFHDVEVQIGLIGRRSAENLQRRKLITFWENYFHKMGGKVIKVERLTGAS